MNMNLKIKNIFVMFALMVFCSVICLSWSCEEESVEKETKETSKPKDNKSEEKDQEEEPDGIVKIEMTLAAGTVLLYFPNWLRQPFRTLWTSLTKAFTTG